MKTEQFSGIKRLFDIPYFQLKNKPLSNAFNTKINDQWISTSIESLIEKFNSLSKALLKIGIQKDDKIAVISKNNITEWHILDYAIQQIGAISVPIYPTISTSDYQYIFNHAEIKYCFLSDESILEKLIPVKNDSQFLKEIYTFESIKNYKSIEDLILLGNKSNLNQELETIKNTINYEDLVTIIYTSGTTGFPKGVMLSHKNLISNIINTLECVPPKVERALSFLPICHVFERMATYVYQLESIEIYFAESLEKLSINAQEIKPNIMTVVPRVIEKVYDKIMAKASELKGIKKHIFNWSLKLANKNKPYKEQSFWYNLQLNIAKKLVFQKWKDALGGEIKGLISGSAPLQERLVTIFFAAGLPILEGYGMTETSPIISGAKLEKGRFKPGTTGKPLANITIKIAEDGEILVKGDNIMMGYYKDPELTKNAFTEDGFLKTGDIGFLSKTSLLKITDRKKEIFKTSGGKYIAPQINENLIKSSPFIENAMVVGEGEKMPCAFLIPDFEYIKNWIKEKNYFNIDISSNKTIIESKEVLDKIKKEIDNINHKLGSWEQIKKFTLIPDNWSVEDGILTPTLKLKRKIIMQLYQKEYELMYGRI